MSVPVLQSKVNFLKIFHHIIKPLVNLKDDTVINFCAGFENAFAFTAVFTANANVRILHFICEFFMEQKNLFAYIPL